MFIFHQNPFIKFLIGIVSKPEWHVEALLSEGLLVVKV